MIQRESDAIVTYLHGGRADWIEKVNPVMLTVWYDGLKLFPADMSQEAVKTFFAQRDAKREGFPPEIGEVVRFLDRAWERQQERAREEQRVLEDTAARKLLAGPAEAWGGDGQGIAPRSVALVQALMDGTLTPGSPEHRAEQVAIEAMGRRSAVAPCCDRDGLVTYRVKKFTSTYAYSARCPCPRGLASPYAGFPVLPDGLQPGT